MIKIQFRQSDKVCFWYLINLDNRYGERAIDHVLRFVAWRWHLDRCDTTTAQRYEEKTRERSFKDVSQ